MDSINKEINKTRYKVLFNSLIVNSETYLKLKVFWSNGLKFKVTPINNTQLNKYLLRI